MVSKFGQHSVLFFFPLASRSGVDFTPKKFKWHSRNPLKIVEFAARLYLLFLLEYNFVFLLLYCLSISGIANAPRSGKISKRTRRDLGSNWSLGSCYNVPAPVSGLNWSKTRLEPVTLLAKTISLRLWSSFPTFLSGLRLCRSPPSALCTFGDCILLSNCKNCI